MVADAIGEDGEIAVSTQHSVSVFIWVSELFQVIIKLITAGILEPLAFLVTVVVGMVKAENPQFRFTTTGALGTTVSLEALNLEAFFVR